MPCIVLNAHLVDLQLPALELERQLADRLRGRLPRWLAQPSKVRVRQGRLRKHVQTYGHKFCRQRSTGTKISCRRSAAMKDNP